MKWLLLSTFLAVMLFGCSGEQFCPCCNGQGKIADKSPLAFSDSQVTCPVCQGKGKVPKL